MDRPGEVEDLAAELYAGIGLFLRRFRQVPVGDGLSLPERSAMARLDRAGPSTAAELARIEQITPQAMGTTLAGLEARGLVDRRRDPRDRRRIILSVSEAGVEVLRRKRDLRAQQLAAALAGEFTARELQALQKAAPLLQRLGERV